MSVEVFWPPRPESRRSQSMVIESLLSSIEEFAPKALESYRAECAINHCPFCSSSLIRIYHIAPAGHRYKCDDCDMSWTMNDPVV